MQMERKCPTCKGEIIGRTEKRFCSDQCRFLFNKVKKKENISEKFIQKVNAARRKNRTLLKQASPKGKTTLRREVLQLAGFNFDHFTHLYRAKNGNTYHFCYDYDYLLLEDGKVLIVNWQPYMEKG